MSWDNQGKLFRKGIISRDYVDVVKFGHTKLRAADISVEKNTTMGILIRKIIFLENILEFYTKH